MQAQEVLAQGLGLSTMEMPEAFREGAVARLELTAKRAGVRLGVCHHSRDLGYPGTQHLRPGPGLRLLS